jgi:hypothetical protein
LKENTYGKKRCRNHTNPSGVHQGAACIDFQLSAQVTLASSQASPLTDISAERADYETHFACHALFFSDLVEG